MIVLFFNFAISQFELQSPDKKRNRESMIEKANVLFYYQTFHVS